MWYNWLIHIAKGLGAGAIYGLTGYMKKPKEEPFSYLKAFIALFEGAAAGVIAGAVGMPIEGGMDYLVSAGLIGIVDYVAKAAWRKVIKPLLEKIGLQ
jgi:hypothetical protein